MDVYKMTKEQQAGQNIGGEFSQYFITHSEEGTENYCQQLQQTVKRLSETLAQHKTPAPVATSTALANNDQCLPVNKSALDFKHSLENVIENIVKQSVMVNHPDCCAHLHCPPLIPALAAEIVLTAINQSMDSWDQALAATLLEQQLIDWLCQQLNYGAQADGSFTSGGTQSNLVGLLLARNHIIAQQHPNYNVQQQGLPDDAKRYRIFCSEAAHFTITKSCSLLGLGR